MPGAFVCVALLAAPVAFMSLPDAVVPAEPVLPIALVSAPVAVPMFAPLAVLVGSALAPVPGPPGVVALVRLVPAVVLSGLTTAGCAAVVAVVSAPVVVPAVFASCLGPHAERPMARILARRMLIGFFMFVTSWIRLSGVDYVYSRVGLPSAHCAVICRTRRTLWPLGNVSRDYLVFGVLSVVPLAVAVGSALTPVPGPPGMVALLRFVPAVAASGLTTSVW